MFVEIVVRSFDLEGTYPTMVFDARANGGAKLERTPLKMAPTRRSLRSQRIKLRKLFFFDYHHFWRFYGAHIVSTSSSKALKSKPS